MDKNKIETKAKIFRTLNGRDMNMADYIRSASDEELIIILQENFVCRMNKNDMQKILNKKIIDFII